MGVTFTVIYWLQSFNYRNKNIKYTLFDKLKLPIISSALVGLIYSFCSKKCIDENKQDVFISLADF